MNVANALIGRPLPMIPKVLNGRVHFVCTCELSPHELELFSVGLDCLSQTFSEDQLKAVRPKGTIIVLGSPTLELEWSGSDVLGQEFSVMVYPLYLWREKQLSDYQMLTCILEELCHRIFDIDDEILVKYKVAEAVQKYNPKISKELLYPGVAFPPC